VRNLTVTELRGKYFARVTGLREKGITQGKRVGTENWGRCSEGGGKRRENEVWPLIPFNLVKRF